MSEPIGFQDGITSWADWFRAMGKWQTAYAQWAGLPNDQRGKTKPPIPPKIAARGPNYNPDDLSTWPWPDKLERTLRILKDEHDAAIPPDPPNGPPTYVKVAPRVAFKAGGSDARYCTVGQPGVVPDGPPGHTKDESGATYDDNGLCKNGIRSDGPALTSALEIDGRPYCSLPTMGDPLTNTGSWEI